MLATKDPARLAHLEPYLLDVVGAHFRVTGQLALEDFWLILIWKANRAKNNARRRFEQVGKCTFEQAVSRIALALSAAQTRDARLRVLMRDWGMKLPTASAVLTVLYPESFTVYDIRVCDQLGGFHELATRRFSSRLWNEYQKFVAAVESAAPPHLTLRQKDHHLWGLSLMEQVSAELTAPVPARNPRRPKTFGGQSSPGVSRADQRETPDGR